MHDSLGDRMKRQYEDISRVMLPRRTHTIVRVDGKAFHAYTRKMERPYDKQFMEVMDAVACALCAEMQGSQFAFVQSDEISVLLTDFAKPDTSAWFDGNLQKIVSISASVATAEFNSRQVWGRPHACFDSRAFTIPDYIEVENYFIWRQKDAERNSIQMLAQHYASHKQLHGKNISEQQDIIHDHGDNWNDHPAGFKRGRIAQRHTIELEPPIFTQDRDYLRRMIPRHWQESAPLPQEVETRLPSR
jgi:tRNA(His) guanylyltransferase